MKIIPIAIALALTSCASTQDTFTDTKINSQTINKAYSYSISALQVYAIIPTLEQDIIRALSTVRESKDLTPNEKIVLNNASEELVFIIEGIRSIVDVDVDTVETAVLSASHLDEYIHVSRAVYNDVRDVVLNHMDSFSNVQLYRLHKLDKTMHQLDRTYEFLVNSKVNGIDVTSIISDLMLAMQTAMRVASPSLTGTTEKGD